MKIEGKTGDEEPPCPVCINEGKGDKAATILRKVITRYWELDDEVDQFRHSNFSTFIRETLFFY